jgi:hypothetical protein
MTEQEMRDVLARHLAAEEVHDAEAAAATYVENGYYDLVPLGIRFEGRDMVAFQYASSYDLIRNSKATYDWDLVRGDTIVQCGRLTGEVGQQFLGIPTTGDRFDFPFTAVITFRDGMMEGEHVHYDLELFCQQAGVDVNAVREAAAALRAPATA